VFQFELQLPTRLRHCGGPVSTTEVGRRTNPLRGRSADVDVPVEQQALRPD
jgi:hypothetical protein